MVVSGKQGERSTVSFWKLLYSWFNQFAMSIQQHCRLIKPVYTSLAPEAKVLWMKFWPMLCVAIIESGINMFRVYRMTSLPH
jgi:hypothetical protein